MNRVGWTPALLFSIWSSLCGAATPGLGTPHEGGLFIFREPVEMYWNDWVAYPRDDKAAVLDQPEATIKADGKTVSFNALLKINCKTRKFSWVGAKNFNEALLSESDLRRVVPSEVTQNAARLLCTSKWQTGSDRSSAGTKGLSFALPPCPAGQRLDNCFGTHTFPSGNEYVGEWRNGKPSGQGTQTFPSGNKYVGEWRDGKPSGQGTFTFADGRKQEGIWNDGKFQNAQTVTPPEVEAEKKKRQELEAQLTQAREERRQAAEAKERERQQAQAPQIPQPQARSSLLPCPDKRDPTTSPWLNCFGTYIYPKGTKYVGEFRDDQHNGQGTFTFANGDKYVGEWREGKRSGQGTYTSADGRKQEGIWIDNKLQSAQAVPVPAVPSSQQTVAPQASAPAHFAVDWEPGIVLGGEFYPALIVSTATRKSQAQPPPNVHGDPSGFLYVTMKNSTPGTRVVVAVTIDDIAKPSSLEVTLDKVGEFRFYPKVQYNYQTLTNMLQPRPVNVTFTVSVNGQAGKSKSLVSRVRSINEAPFAMMSDTGVRNLGWVFAAFVNEDHPWIDGLLKEALKAGRVRKFNGYMSGNPKEVYAQVEAVWNALNQRGIRYSSITETSGESKKVKSQHVRFLSDSIRNTQANCIDGTVLLASVLRKIGIEPTIVLVPGHAFLGFNLDKSKRSAAYLETTMLGTDPFRAALERGNTQARKWAPQVGLNPLVSFINVADERSKGVMPIAR